MNRVKYLLDIISDAINKTYNVNICLCCNDTIYHNTYDYIIHRDFNRYFYSIINELDKYIDLENMINKYENLYNLLLVLVY